MSIVSAGIVSAGIVKAGIVHKGIFGDESGSSCTGYIITTGKDSTNWGYIEGLYGEIEDPPPPGEFHLYAIYATPADELILRFGVAGADNTGIDSGVVNIKGYAPDITVGWDATDKWYIGTAVGIFDLISNSVTFCAESGVSQYTLYAASYDRDAFYMAQQLLGAGVPSSKHDVPMLAPDNEGVYREYGVDEPVWQGVRKVTNELLWSEDFSNAAWVLTNSNITAAIDSDPSGGDKAYTLEA